MKNKKIQKKNIKKEKFYSLSSIFLTIFLIVVIISLYILNSNTTYKQEEKYEDKTSIKGDMGKETEEINLKEDIKNAIEDIDLENIIYEKEELQ